MKYNSKITATCVAILMVAVVISITWAKPARKPEPTPLQILIKTANVYVGSKSYRDSGTVKASSTYDGKAGLSIEGEFKTAFISPHRLRYEFKGKMTIPDHDKGTSRIRDIHFIAWHNGPETYRYYGLDRSPVEKSKSLELAIMGGGIDGGLATMPVELLLPGEFQETIFLARLKELKRLGDAKVGAVECYRIQGMLATAPTTVWIDKKTFLIRRMDWGGDLKNTTIWEPSLNVKIDDETLAFNPPRQ